MPFFKQEQRFTCYPLSYQLYDESFSHIQYGMYFCLASGYLISYQLDDLEWVSIDCFTIKTAVPSLSWRKLSILFALACVSAHHPLFWDSKLIGWKTKNTEKYASFLQAVWLTLWVQTRPAPHLSEHIKLARCTNWLTYVPRVWK